MVRVYCCRCSQYSNSPDGSHCVYCENDNFVIPSFSGNFQPAVSESVNVNPGVPALDAIPRMTDEDWSFLDEIGGGGNYPQVSDQEAAANRNLPDNPNINQDNIYYTNINRCNPASIGPSLGSVTDSHVVPEQRAYLNEQPLSNERQYIDEDGKLDFAGSIRYLSEYSILNSIPESSVNVNSPIVLARKKHDSNSDRFPVNVATTKSDLEHEVHNSGKERRNVFKPKMFVEQPLRCGKCGEIFPTEWTFEIHVGNKCYPVSYKCDQCGRTFRYRSDWLRHLPLHNEEEPYECGQCTFSTKWEGSLKKHKENWHK